MTTARRTKAGFAELVFGEAENDYGSEVPTVTARCCDSGDESEEIFGDHERSIRRALASLSAACSCGARFHLLSGPGGRAA